MKYATEQEDFWAGTFGSDYIARNQGQDYLASNLNFFSRIFQRLAKPTSIVEFGANIGMNLRALRLLFPEAQLSAIEINPDAAHQLRQFLGNENVHHGSILEFQPQTTVDVSLIKGVLIHLPPESLPQVYDKLYAASHRYILVCEYYNPSPVSIPYRGHTNKLFKRDFAGELMDRYPDVQLIDYGFVYRRDPSFPQDDVTWFLMEKRQG
jgi:spore coat polysaccharide biosynthesis protein SpsF